MGNNAVQFMRKRMAQRKRIILHPVNADKNITFNYIFLVGGIEGDNVSVIVVIQVLLVYLQQMGVRTKNVIQVLKRFAFRSNNVPNPFLYYMLMRKFERSILGKEGD